MGKGGRPSVARRLWAHVYTLILAIAIGSSSTVALLEVYGILSARLNQVVAIVAAIAVSVVVLFLAMLAAEELTRTLVKRRIV